MVNGSALQSGHRLSNRRGAAFLLAVYFASLMFLVLGGVSLQRTMTEVKASLLSRDTHQSFWNSEAAFDQALTALRAKALPPFDALGCAYASIQFDPSIDSRGNSMICKATNPDGTINPTQYRVDLLGTSMTSGPVWITTFVERKAPEVTLTNALVGLEDIAISHAKVGGLNTTTSPVALSLATLANLGLANLMTGTDVYGDFVPTLAGLYTNQGHIATKATTLNALRVTHGSEVLGTLLTGMAGVASISPDTNTPNMGTGPLPSGSVDFPPVRVPTTLPALGATLQAIVPPIVGVSVSHGVVTIDHAWAVVAPGAYRADGLVLQDAVFSTNGPVDLYIKGAVSVTRSLLYGQTLCPGEIPCPAAGVNLLKFSPPNLRIFVQPAASSDKVRVTKGSVVAGVIYAPQLPVRIDHKSLLMGAMVSKTAQVGLMPDEAFSYREPSDAQKTQVYYDEAVGAQPVHPSLDTPQASVLYYSVHKSLTEGHLFETDPRFKKWLEFLPTVFTPPPTPPLVSSPSYGGPSCGTDFGILSGHFK